MDRAGIWKLLEFRPDDFVLPALVVSFGIIMRIEFRNRPPQRRLADQDDSVQAGTLNTTYKTVRESIQIGTSRRKSERFHAGAFEHFPQLLGEQCGSLKRGS